MDKDDEIVLVCLPVGFGRPVEGSVQMRCGTCMRPVWVSGTGIRAAGVEARLVCVPCAQPIMADPENEVQPVTDEQMQEIVEETDRRAGRWRFHPPV